MTGFSADRIMKELNGRIDDYVAKLGEDIVRAIIAATPVDTTYARSSWIANIGSMSVVEQEEIPDGGPTPQMIAARRVLQDKGIQSLKAYELPMGRIFISNNVPYILELNAGSSRQANLPL